MKLPAPLVPTEEMEQIYASRWLTQNGILHFHVPNGGKRNAIEAAKLKRMGVKSGVPDIFIPLARKSFHGLFIELKRVFNGHLNSNQDYWLKELRLQGYDCFVAKGADALIEYVKNYLDMS